MDNDQNENLPYPEPSRRNLIYRSISMICLIFTAARAKGDNIDDFVILP